MRQIEYCAHNGDSSQIVWTGLRQLPWSPGSELGHIDVTIPGKDERFINIFYVAASKGIRLSLKAMSSELVGLFSRSGLYYITILCSSKTTPSIAGTIGLRWDQDAGGFSSSNVWLEPVTHKIVRP
jgi:hypothetical protein